MCHGNAVSFGMSIHNNTFNIVNFLGIINNNNTAPSSLRKMSEWYTQKP